MIGRQGFLSSTLGERVLLHGAVKQVYALVGPPRGALLTMHRESTPLAPPPGPLLAERAFATLERFLHIEAASGILLLFAAVVALIWANSPLQHSYHSLWHLPVSFAAGGVEFSKSLHFIINDALMTVFFLVVGLEIRREIHEGALNSLRQASLPIAAALGGVMVPALIYLSVNVDPSGIEGWAVPTATDIAFAIGVLALLGRGIPSNLRVLLLALAIIDDIIAVLIIAFFYSGGLEWYGFVIAGLGVLAVYGFQRAGIGSALAYIAPGAIVWVGLLMAGAHPTLAGVLLGMMTPVVSLPMRQRPVERLVEVAQRLDANGGTDSGYQLATQLRQLRLAQRELLPPVVRVQSMLHPWVAFIVMPLFALTNAGVSLGGVDLSVTNEYQVALGILLALVVGKPLGILGMSWLVVRLGWCQLPPEVSWSGMLLIGLLGGIGFTMSIFISMLAFEDAPLLGAAKLGVLAGSLIAIILGLAWGLLYLRRHRISD